MPRLKFAPAQLLALFATLVLTLPRQQNYPAKPIRVVVSTAGGGLDVLARQLGERGGRHLGQSMVIDNRPGAGTIIGADAVTKSAPDGYTLMITADTTITLNQSLYSKLPYDPVKDFAPVVTQLVLLNQMLIAHPAVPANSLKELLTYAKANPGKPANYASYGSGTPPHLAMETLKNITGSAITHVPYKGLAQAVPAVLAGEVQMTFSGAASSMALIKSGRLRALAIGGKNRLALLPEVPTFAELGYAEVPASTWFGVFAPAGTCATSSASCTMNSGRRSPSPSSRKRKWRPRASNWWPIRRRNSRRWSRPRFRAMPRR